MQQRFFKKETTPLVQLYRHSSIHRHDVMLKAAQVFQKQADLSPRSSAKVTNTWSYTSAPLHITWNGADQSKGITLPSVFISFFLEIRREDGKLWTSFLHTVALINLLFLFALKTYSIRYYRSGTRVPHFATLPNDLLAVLYCGVLIQSGAQTCQNTVSASAVPIWTPSAEDTSASCLTYGCLISCGGLKGCCFGCWHPLPYPSTSSSRHSPRSNNLWRAFIYVPHSCYFFFHRLPSPVSGWYFSFVFSFRFFYWWSCSFLTPYLQFPF